MAGHVYLIGSKVFHWYKIGKSNNATIRVSDLGILLPFRVEVIAIWKVHDHHATERLLHEKYEKNRINGEWFSFTHAQTQHLLKSMREVRIRVAENFSNLAQDSIENILKAKGHLPTPIVRDIQDTPMKRKERGGKQVRIDELTKENAILRHRVLELEKVLDEKDLPVV